MSDFKFIAFVVFLFIVFGAFMASYSSSQYEYQQMQNASDSETSFDQITNMTDFETHSVYGKMFLGGLAVLMAIIIIRFVRGQ